MIHNNNKNLKKKNKTKMASKFPGQSEKIKVIISLPYLLPTQMDTQVKHGPVRDLTFSLIETAL